MEKLAIITPSYAPDFERCQLLCRSIKRFINSRPQHYIIVDADDWELFHSLENEYTKIITLESIIPDWLKKLPLKRNIWVSWKTIPIRGWIIQQIIKIAVAQQMEEDIAMFVDSDVFFVSDFDIKHLFKKDKTRLFYDIQGNEAQKKMHLIWHQSATKLLGLEAVDPEIPNYVGNLITWKKKHVQQMCSHIENVTGKDWMRAVGNSWHFSEYVLYGTFIQQVLKEESEHYCEASTLSLDYWQEKSLSAKEIKDFRTNLEPQQVAIMISAKSGTPLHSYLWLESYEEVCQLFYGC